MTILFILISLSCNWINTAPPIQLDKIILPPGFKIEVYAENIKNARSMALSPDGTLFVGTRDGDKVYAIKDLNGDHKADKTYTVAS
ncbi:MAG: sorbosone dehydrogenase family protein, partial [Saprospiraceae bacterium]